MSIFNTLYNENTSFRNENGNKMKTSLEIAFNKENNNVVYRFSNAYNSLKHGNHTIRIPHLQPSHLDEMFENILRFKCGSESMNTSKFHELNPKLAEGLYAKVNLAYRKFLRQ